MSSDLIFHIVSRRKWHTLNKDGFYKPEGFEEEVGTKCITPAVLKEYMNTNYKGRKNLLLLVIDKSRLANSFKTKKEEGIVFVQGGINVDAILDKIRVDCSPEGTFNIEVSTE